MTKANKILIALLVSQLALIALVYTRSDATSVLPPRLLLEGFDAESVTKIAISEAPREAPDEADKEKDTAPDIVLERDGEGWILSSHAGYAAQAEDVDKLLAELAQAKVRAPIATTQSRQTQLRVAADDFRKKVVVTARGKEIAFFLGEFAAGGTVAIRLADDEAIYAVPSAVSSAASASVRSWVDPAIVQIATDDIATMAVDTADGQFLFELLPGGKEWKLLSAPDGVATDKPLDHAYVSRMAGKLARLNLSDIAGKTPAPEHGLSAPRVTVTVTLKPETPPAGTEEASTPAASVAGEVTTLLIGAENDDHQVFVKTAASPYVFTVPKTTVEPFIEAGTDTVIKAADPDKDKAKSGGKPQAKKPAAGKPQPKKPAAGKPQPKKPAAGKPQPKPATAPKPATP